MRTLFIRTPLVLLCATFCGIAQAILRALHAKQNSRLNREAGQTGDSDSTGAVCGNILGAYLGYSAIPEKFKANLEFHDVLLDIADDLYAARTDDEVYRAKYIAKTFKPCKPR